MIDRRMTQFQRKLFNRWKKFYDFEEVVRFNSEEGPEA